MTLLNKTTNVFSAIGFMTCWLVVIIPWYDIVYGGWVGQRMYQEPSFINQFWIGCIMAPVFEELFFRKIWIDITQKYFPHILPISIIASSLLFAWWHGYQYWAILVQGVLGIVSSWLYIKNENSYLSCVIFHAGYNFQCLWGFKLLAE